jgi:hypothetical protein
MKMNSQSLVLHLGVKGKEESEEKKIGNGTEEEKA